MGAEWCVGLTQDVGAVLELQSALGDHGDGHALVGHVHGQVGERREDGRVQQSAVQVVHAARLIERHNLGLLLDVDRLYLLEAGLHDVLWEQIPEEEEEFKIASLQ